MRTIGLIGGMSWESTELYYRLINEETRRRLGGLHSARIAMISVNFHDIEVLQREGAWDEAAAILCRAARQVEQAGADLLLICTNTMHKVADDVAASVNIPLLHIAGATARRVIDSGVNIVGLLGTRFTMEEEFYRGRLEQHGLTVITPPAASRERVHRVIYDELCLGVVNAESRSAFVDIVNDLASQGAEAVIAGCTEIGMLVDDMHTDIKLFDTTRIHAEQAVTAALEQAPTTRLLS